MHDEVWNTDRRSIASDALRKNERQDETQFSTKIDGFSKFQSLLECECTFLLQVSF
jgi:hypothetical protein